MQLKKSFFAIVIALMAILTLANGVSAAQADVDPLDITISTDQPSYEQNEAITSTIKITNPSKRYSAKNMTVQTVLPEEFDIIDKDKDIFVKDGQVTWNVEDLERGDTLELTFQTKLKQTASEDKDEATPGAADKIDKNHDKQDKQVEPVNTSKEELASPQTGDQKSFLTYAIILFLSLAAGVIAFIALRKKRLSKSITLLLALTVMVPAFSVVHAETMIDGVNSYSLTKSHQFTIGDETYEVKTTVIAEKHDHYVDIPVTGTATDTNGNLLSNTSLTFTATVYDEQIEEVVETDEEGYFVSRLAKDATYTVKGEQLSSTIKAIDTNEVEVSNGQGVIELGKKLTNGDNFTKLQPSVIYLSDKEAAKVSNISDDLTTAAIQGNIDIQANDFIVIPEREGFPGGISFFVSQVNVTNGQTILHIAEPELEDIFFEIVGDLSAEMTPENFVPAEGVTIVGGEDPLPATYLSRDLITPYASIGKKLTLSLDDLYKDDKFSVNGSIEISGNVGGDIKWRAGLNPIEEMDFNFQGEQKISADMEIKGEKELPDVTLGFFTVPTQIPGVVVVLPVDFVSSVSGKISYKITAGMKQNVGLAYERGSGMRTYPEDKFQTEFNASDINGTGKASVGVKLSGIGKALGWDIVKLEAQGDFNGTATTSILGANGLFNCISFASTFDRSLALKAPIFKWEGKADIGNSIPLWSKTFGSCVSDITINPNEIELEPGETKSVTITARDNTTKKEINDSDKIEFNISDSTKVKVDQKSNRVDIKATDLAMDGDIIMVEVVYDQHGEKITDQLKVNIVDNRPKGELIGKVSDAVQGNPLNEATVKVFKGSELAAEVKTAEDGSYKANLSPGDYKVEVSYPNYITDTSRITIESTDTTTYDAKLELVGDEYGGIGTVKGQISNAVNGRGIEEVILEIRKGKNNTTGEIFGTATTDSSGNYEVDLPGGNYTILLQKEGYITTHANIIAIGDETKSNQNATLSPDGVVDENLRIVLTWGKDPSDLDSHITGPKADGGRFHVYYVNKDYQDEANDVNLDRDDVTSYGPETVTVINRIQEGTYTYAVHNYTGRYLTEDNQLELANSNAKVEIYRADTLLATYNVPLEQAGNSWRVFEIRNGEIVPINKMETIEDWDSADSFAPMN